MRDRSERTTPVAKKKTFFINDSSGKRRKVNPKKKRFNGTVGEQRLDQDTLINGHVYPAGVYPFVFWDVPTFDKNDNPIEDKDGSVADVDQEFPPDSTDGGPSLSDAPPIGGWGGNEGSSFVPAPDPTPTSSHSSSHDSSSSSSSHDSGSSSSSSSSDGGGGGGGSD